MSDTFYSAFDFIAYEEKPDTKHQDSRSAFQRDRDRVIFSYAFRRLQSKTQVFQSGEYDFYRTRLTHSLEVARIARSIGEEINRRHPTINVDGDLLEAVGLAHDLGHPPFGHIGERKLNELMQPWGGFEGNAQTVRILTEIFWQRNDSPQGMQPSRAFLDGVMKYKALWSEFPERPENHFLYDEQSNIRNFVADDSWPQIKDPKACNRLKSLECQIMDWADDTAYSLHDIVDGVKAGFITRKAVEAWITRSKDSHPELAESPALEALLNLIEKDYLEAIFAKKVGEFIRSVELEHWDENPLKDKTPRHGWKLTIPQEIKTECALYKTIALDLVFRSPRIQQVEFKSGFLIERLFNALIDSHLNHKSDGRIKLQLLPEPALTWLQQTTDEKKRARLICDAIAQLTDHEAIRLYRRLFDPDYGSISELL
ncbi:dGTP triphosphohydrolase [Rubellicoccus peritrichatus]|uniref:DNTP triphosphohydrolase n=1 Tax=Rubellicoccus peritrichatus TaxID=3080537 RepID=A0AAQ3L6X5_9BACT|nr:dNTP triphosphohydrolase [Puniceicoccus sp. CR14]WOO39792.1 dNTP triphosphohydrolase [Puniceicoccus sp. CR14]